MSMMAEIKAELLADRRECFDWGYAAAMLNEKEAATMVCSFLKDHAQKQFAIAGVYAGEMRLDPEEVFSKTLASAELGRQ